MIRAVLALAALATCAGALPPACRAAADPEEATLDRGLELRDQNRLGEATRMLEELYRKSPEDVRTGRLYAETLAWWGRLTKAERVYLDLVARGDSLSLLGLAQTHAWSGDLRRSASEYEEIAKNPGLRARALVGLARVRYWQGRYTEAERLRDEAGPAAAGAETRRLSLDLARVRSGRVIARTRSERGNDENHYWLAQAGVGGPLWRDVDGEALAGIGEVDRDSDRYRLWRGEVGLDGAVGGLWSMGLRGGIERRDPRETAVMADASRTDRGFFAAALRADAGRWTAAWNGEVRYPSDTAALIKADIRLSSTGVDASWLPTPWLRADTGGALGSFSDSNDRSSYYAGIQLRIPDVRPIPTLGFVHRAMRNTRSGTGVYFSPKRYRLDEGFLSLEQRLFQNRLRYFVRASFGAQEIEDRSFEMVGGFRIGIDYRVGEAQLSFSADRTDAATLSTSGYARTAIGFGVALFF